MSSTMVCFGGCGATFPYPRPRCPECGKLLISEAQVGCRQVASLEEIAAATSNALTVEEWEKLPDDEQHSKRAIWRRGCPQNGR